VIDASNIEMVVSPALLDELEDVLRRDWMRRYIPLDHIPDAMRVIVTSARLEKDVPNPPRRVKDDPDDDYIVALAVSTNSTLVTGDGGVRKLRPEGYDVMTIAELLAAIEGRS
jgi:predicted nucleic acid-binding protein